MTFWVPSGDLQTVWVSATYKQLLSYRIAPYDQPESYNAHLFNGHAYSFVTSFDEDFDTGYSEARKTFFLGKSGYLMTIESKGERNAVSHVLSEGPGWIGGTNATEQPGVIGGTSTTNAIRGYYVEFDGFDPRLAGQVMTTSATIGSENYDSHTESSESTNPAEADTKPDKSGASDVSDAKPDTKTDPSESDIKPDKPANSAKQHTAKLSLANTGLSTLVLVLTALSLLAAALITAALRHCSNE